MNIPLPQSSSDARKFANGIDASGNLTFDRVDVTDLSYKGRFGALAYSTTENTISIGEKYFTLDLDEGKFRTGDDILITSLDDPDCYMWGEVINTDTVWEPIRLKVFADDLSALTGTYQNWELQVVARPKPGIEKDTSTSSVNPTTGGPWPFTVTAGKFFPIGGTLLIKPTTDRSIALIGEVDAYSGTSLTVSLRATNATVSQSYTSWSIALLDSPPRKLTKYEIIGLRVNQVSGDFTTYTLQPGTVMDTTGTIPIIIDDAITLDCDAEYGTGNGAIVRVALTGTVTGSGTTLTGSGTTFVTDLTYGGNADFEDQGGDVSLIGSANKTIIGTSTRTSHISTITDDTNGTLFNNTFNVTGAAYYRNGFAALMADNSAAIITYYVVVGRRTSDGAGKAWLSSATPSGVPDNPSGFSAYRTVASITVQRTSGIRNDYSVIRQPLWTKFAAVAPPELNYLVIGQTVPDEIPNAYNLIDDTSNIIKNVPADKQLSLTINSNAVSNTKLADMAAYTLKGRNAGTSGDPSDIDITALTEQTSPTTTDYLIGVDTAASNAFKKYKASNFGGGTSFPSDMGLITEAATTTFDCGTIV